MKKMFIYIFLIISILSGCGSASTEVKEEILEPITQEEVDPDIVAYLDNFKQYVDDYIDLIEMHYSMSEEMQLANIVSWGKCVNEYNNNCITVNDAYRQLDEKGLLSDADKAYWMEVYADCTIRVLEALGDESESE